MSKVIVPIGDLPGAIRESARCVLAANRVTIHSADGRKLLGPELECLLRELGNNAAQSVVCLDEQLVDRDEELAG